MDAVFTLAHGLDALIKEKCPLAFANTSLLESCINGATYLEFIKNISFLGSVGQIQFDENGDTIGRFIIKQQVDNNYNQIGKWINVG